MQNDQWQKNDDSDLHISTTNLYKMLKQINDGGVNAKNIKHNIPTSRNTGKRMQSEIRKLLELKEKRHSLINIRNAEVQR